jgi:ribosome-associated protein
MKIEFKLENEYIELFKLLKLYGVSESGAQAKNDIADGEVFVNGETEFRKRRKIRVGDVINVFEYEIKVN